MSEQIKVQYGEVYNKVFGLRGRIQTQLIEMEAQYRHIQSSLEGLDSAANAGLKATMESNKVKAYMVADTLDKLLSFIANSSRQVEMDEQKILSYFEPGTITTGGVR